MGGLFAGILKAIGGMFGGGAAASGASGALGSLSNAPSKMNYANMGVDSSAWGGPGGSAPQMQQAPQSSSPSMGSLIGAGMANSGRGGKGRQQSEQMAQAFASGPDMSQPQNPMSFLQQLQSMPRQQNVPQQQYAQPSALMQHLLQMYSGGQQ